MTTYPANGRRSGGLTGVPGTSASLTFGGLVPTRRNHPNDRRSAPTNLSDLNIDSELSESGPVAPAEAY